MPKLAALRIAPCPSKPETPHMVYVPLKFRHAAKGVQRRYFETKTKAQKFIDDLNRDIETKGIHADNMPESERRLWVECQELLKPYNATILEAVRAHAEVLKASGSSCTVTELMERYVSFIEDNSLHKKDKGFEHARAAETKTRRFVEIFGGTLVARITLQDASNWLRVQATRKREIDGAEIPAEWIPKEAAAARTVNGYRAYLRGAFEYARTKGWVPKNVWADTKMLPAPDNEAVIYTPGEFMKLFNVTDDPQMKIYFALGAMEGLRPACEIYEMPKVPNSGLKWSQIKWEKDIIFLFGDGPTSTFRGSVVLQPNVKKLLLVHRKESGFVVTLTQAEVNKRRRAAVAAAGLTWKADILRKSFASHRLAATNNIDTTRSDMRHETNDMIRKHYLNTGVDKEQGEAWFALDLLGDKSNFIALPDAVAA